MAVAEASLRMVNDSMSLGLIEARALLTPSMPELQTVDHDHRVLLGAERRSTAHADRRGAAGLAGAGRDDHAGALAEHQIGGRGDQTLVELVGLDGGHRTGHVVLLDGAVADDDHFVEGHKVLFEHQTGKIGRRSHALDRLITDVADFDNRLRALHRDGESAVDVGRYTVDGALFDDGSADDGIAGVVNDNAVDRVLRLSEDSEGGGCRRIGS